MMRIQLQRLADSATTWIQERLLPRGPLTDDAVPLLFGVTGHRDLRPQDEPVLRARIAALLAQYRRRCPATPFILLSSLAEGADRLVAQEALKISGMRLAAILPVPADDYESDFATEESRREFRGLLAAAAFVDAPSPRPNRDLAYQVAGCAVAENCHVLIALWNGQDTGLVGGTADIIKHKLEGLPTIERHEGDFLVRGEHGVVLHLVTARRDGYVPKHLNDVITLRPGATPQAGAAIATDLVARRLDSFNREIGAARRAWSNRDAALTLRDLSGGNDALAAEVARRAGDTLRLHQMASYFANRLSLAYRRDTAVVTFFGVLAAIALQLQVHAYDNGSSFVIAQSALLAAMWATWYFGSVLRLKDRYQEYRAAAEGARVQVFWQIVGVTERTADHFLVGQESALDWIRRALRTVALIDGWRASAAGAHDGSLDEALLDLTTRHWIDAQASYFAGAVAQGHKKAARVGVWIAALFVLAALGFASRLLGGSLDPAAAMLLRQASGIVTTSALAVSAGLGGYLHVMAYGSLPNRYESMMLLMKRALAGLGMTAGQPDRVAKSRAILAAIGREALSENARWVILQQTLVVKP